MMFSSIRKHLNPTTVLAFAALIFAMTGGAFAATGGSGGSGAKATASATGTPLATVAKKKPAPKGKAGPRGPAGKNGTNGTNGAPGATGPGGPAGPTGPAGGPGTAGAAGSAGAAGTSVTSSKEAAGANCTDGGSKFVAGSSTTYACNGSPWTAGGTLPKGSSETGQWVEPVGIDYKQLQLTYAPISFSIPLAGELEASSVHFIKPNETPLPAGCNGSVEKPEAESGNLCVFASTFTENTIVSATFINASGGTGAAGTTGTILQFQLSALEEGAAFARGTWAVKG